jgi:hypothetical protein
MPISPFYESVGFQSNLFSENYWLDSMADIKDWRLLYLKGALFVGLGLLAAGIILIKYPDCQFKDNALNLFLVYLIFRKLLHV